MKNKMLLYVIDLLLQQLTPELINRLVVQLLEYIEKHIMGTESKVDDAIVLPLCGILREIFDTADIK